MTIARCHIYVSSRLTVIHLYNVHITNKIASYGPRGCKKQKQNEVWSSGNIPPPLLVSIASNIFTTSSISGRFSGFLSQHFFMILAKALGQHLGISGRKFCARMPSKYDFYVNIYWEGAVFSYLLVKCLDILQL